MENEDYRIINVNDTMIKCFRDGRIHTLCKYSNKYCKKGEWIERKVKPNFHGYKQISIRGKMCRVHRLIMLAFVGESDKDVDHINRIKTDNRFENLRYVTRCENNWNKEDMDNAKGYYWDKKLKKWRSQISIDSKEKHLGLFEKEEDARQAYLDAKSYRS